MSQALRTRERLRPVADGPSRPLVSGTAQAAGALAVDKFPAAVREAAGEPGHTWVILAISLIAIALASTVMTLLGLVTVAAWHMLRIVPVPTAIAHLAGTLWAAF